MKSILDFEKARKETEEKKNKNVNSAFMSIDQVLTQLDILLNENEDLDGIFFLKNRSALMQDNPVAYVANFKGEKRYANLLLNQKIKYSNFPRWRNILSNDDLAEIELLANSQEPFLFEDDKSFLISAVKEERFNWGMLVAFAPKGKIWTKNQLKLIKSFSKLLCSALHYFHQQEKDAFLRQTSIAKDNKRQLIIEKLEQRLEKKNQLIEKLKQGKIGNKTEATFSWKTEQENKIEYDEVWVTVHGFKNGERDPIISKWEKVTDNETLQKVNEIFLKKEHKESIAG